MPEGFARARVRTALGRGKDVTLGFDGPGANQHLPMRGAGDCREGRRCGNQLGTGLAQGAVELRKTQVVTDRQAKPADRRIGHHHIVAMSIVVRLTVAPAIVGHVHVEQMQLVVACHLLATVIDQ
ncbi:hypothetical protein D3C81_1684440 [compost metagenome]